MNRDDFLRALNEKSIAELQRIPKSDLHSHAGRGGNIAYIEKMANVKITPPASPFDSLGEMNSWLNDNVKCHFPDRDGYLERVEAAFAQAEEDNIAILALSFGEEEVYRFGSVDNFVCVMDSLHNQFAPNTLFLPDLACGYGAYDDKLDEILSADWFRGIDIINYANKYALSELKKLCSIAKSHGVLLKAHVGEFDTADDVMRYAETLELDQIQHGIAAASSPQIMKWLAKNKVLLNVCPTSNVMLKRTQEYKTHPIKTLFDYGVPVTISSDDMLIFNASVSQEYLNLYSAGLMTAGELNTIREIGLSSAG
jgi:adenosine deaminase